MRARPRRTRARQGRGRRPARRIRGPQQATAGLMPGGWFESVADAQRRARRTLPRSVYKAIIAGSERGTTLHDNLAAFGELGFLPHVAEAPAERDQTVTVMG